MIGCNVSFCCPARRQARCPAGDSSHLCTLGTRLRAQEVFRPFGARVIFFARSHGRFRRNRRELCVQLTEIFSDPQRAPALELKKKRARITSTCERDVDERRTRRRYGDPWRSMECQKEGVSAKKKEERKAKKITSGLARPIFKTGARPSKDLVQPEIRTSRPARNMKLIGRATRN